MSLFKVDSVEFSSRSQKIINGISLEIQKGTTTAFLGASGSGKSTLLKMIAGILIPTSGEIFFNGQDIFLMNNSENLDFRKKCSFVFQDSALWANQTIVQNLTLPLQVHFPSMSQEERLFAVESICAKVGYDRDLSLRPTDLSTGEQKRIAFARAMILGPEVIFLDECTESLDRRGTKVITELLHNFLEQKNTIIYVSHNPAFINEFPGTIYKIENCVLKEESEK
ncbi:ABC transporter ATP-binding protein [Treponema pectinovorum]|uniref:ABC transporter ATP-binding protein n=1 Tax=Treponema pectinovorum TaxID=164 RepID=UPI003D92FE78